MQRRLYAILLLLLFTTFHTGRLVNFAWCKWKQEIVLNQPDCGCDEVLAKAVSDHDSSKDALPKEKPVEFEIAALCQLQIPSQINTRCYPVYSVTLAEGWTNPALRPPAA